MSIPTLRSLDHTTIKTQGSKGGAFTPPLVKTVGSPPTRALKVKVVRCRHTGLEGRLSPRPSRLPGSLLRASLVRRTCFSHFRYSPQNVAA